MLLLARGSRQVQTLPVLFRSDGVVQVGCGFANVELDPLPVKSFAASPYPLGVVGSQVSISRDVGTGTPSWLAIGV